VVESVPEGVDCGFKVGDHVYGEMPPFVGSFAEHVLAYTDFIAIKPANVSFAEAAALPLAGLTVMQAFDDAKLKDNQRVCIVGASGGTGHVALQVAKARGAVTTAICGSKNAKLMRDYGADHVVCYDTENVISCLQDIAGSDGLFDVVFDSVTSDDPRYVHTVTSTQHWLLFSLLNVLLYYSSFIL
jgi:NADPH:quinone reductase-like Zn-dependent oxidoreductase